jgi:hypothetical protein
MDITEVDTTHVFPDQHDRDEASLSVCKMSIRGIQ